MPNLFLIYENNAWQYFSIFYFPTSVKYCEDNNCVSNANGKLDCCRFKTCPKISIAFKHLTTNSIILFSFFNRFSSTVHLVLNPWHCWLSRAIRIMYTIHIFIYIILVYVSFHWTPKVGPIWMIVFVCIHRTSVGSASIIIKHDGN